MQEIDSKQSVELKKENFPVCTLSLVFSETEARKLEGVQRQDEGLTSFIIAGLIAERTKTAVQMSTLLVGRCAARRALVISATKACILPLA